MKTLVEATKLVEGLAPAADAAGRNGDTVSLKNGHRCTIVVQLTQGNAATVAISVQQSTVVAASDAKAGPACKIWANLDTAASDLLVRQTDGASFTTDAGVKNKIVVIEVDPATLDLANGFDCIRVVTGASNVANITAASYHIRDVRYGGLGAPSAIID